MTDGNILEYDDPELEGDTSVDELKIRPETSYDDEIPKYSITTIGKDIDVEGYVKRMKNETIVCPEYQRKYVWKTPRASLLIESLFIGLPVPQLFLYEEPKGGWSIIDGLQRLTTLLRYYDDEFSLKAPGLSTELRGKKYSDLSPSQKTVLNDASIRSVILKQDAPEKDNSSVYQLFHRINTQSSPLSAQEIRSCVNRGLFNELLISLNSNTKWRSIFGREHTRLRDRELILRFFAIHVSMGTYKPPMTRFLDNFMNDQADISGEDIETLGDLFDKTINLIHDALGNNAFRKPAPNIKALIVTNYDAIMHAIAISIEKDLRLTTEQIKDLSNNLLTNEDYLYGVDEFTNDHDRLTARLKGAEDVLENL